MIQTNTPPAGALYLRNWDLDVYTVDPSGTQVTPNPQGPPQGQATPLSASGELHLTLTHPAGIDTPTFSTKGKNYNQFRSTFKISAFHDMTPAVAIIKIYNLAETSCQEIVRNFNDGLAQQGTLTTRVVLRCSYGDAPTQVIFDGQVIQAFIGRDSAIDSWVLLHAGDGDVFRIYSTVAVSLAAGSTPDDALKAVFKNASLTGGLQFPTGTPNPLTGPVHGIYPRGKVLFGWSRLCIEDLLRTQGKQAHIVNGKLIIEPLEGSGPQPVVVLTYRTGMVSWPIRTNQGIIVKCLINPAITVGSYIKLDNKSVVDSLVNLNLGNTTDPMLAPLADRENVRALLNSDGIYRVYAIDVEGDTRGDVWHQTLTCLSVDPETFVPQDIAAPASRPPQSQQAGAAGVTIPPVFLPVVTPPPAPAPAPSPSPSPTPTVWSDSAALAAAASTTVTGLVGFTTTWNPNDASANLSFSNGNLTVTDGAASSDNLCRSNNFLGSSGKWYWEITDSTDTNSSLASFFGVAVSTALTNEIVGNTGSLGYQSLSGIVRWDGTNQTTIQAGVQGDTIAIAIDLTNELVWFRIIHGVSIGNWNNSGTANPATGVGGISFSGASIAGVSVAPAISESNLGSATTANFGASGFLGPVPSGFTAPGAFA